MGREPDDEQYRAMVVALPKIREKFLRKYPSARRYQDDLDQVARIAVWQAWQRFDWSQGNRFCTLAHAYVWGYMQRLVQKMSHIPVNRYAKVLSGQVEPTAFEHALFSLEYLVDEDRQLVEMIVDPRPGPETVLEKVRGEQLEVLIGRLPARLRETIAPDVRGLAPRHFCERLGVSHRTVRIRRRKAYQRLREMLESER
jgi:RNA polymerase sigma factor (sigma-70 family)